MKKNKIPLAVVDYGLGNLFSIGRALRRIGAQAVISGRPEDVAGADRVILPGVGAFGDGMRGLRENGLIEPLREFAAAGRPLLGICLGMQLFMEEGEEFGVHRGLGIVPGKTVAFPRPQGANFKIPHVGWNGIRPSAASEDSWKGSVFSGLAEGSQVYFVHSFVTEPADSNDLLARTDYGGRSFCAALRHGNVSGCQFHPEKSGPTGLQILKNFVSGG